MRKKPHRPPRSVRLTTTYQDDEPPRRHPTPNPNLRWRLSCVKRDVRYEEMFQRSVGWMSMAFAWGCSLQKTPARTERHASAPVATVCKSDRDCELVDEGCCSCNENGKRVAVLKGHAPQRNCEGVMCAQV